MGKIKTYQVWIDGHVGFYFTTDEEPRLEKGNDVDGTVTTLHLDYGRMPYVEFETHDVDFREIAGEG